MSCVLIVYRWYAVLCDVLFWESNHIILIHTKYTIRFRLNISTDILHILTTCSLLACIYTAALMRPV